MEDNFLPPIEPLVPVHVFWNRKRILIGCALAVFLFLYYFFLSAPRNFPDSLVLTIEPGMTLRSVSLRLEREHVIRSRVAFEAFAILWGGDRHIMYANYLFDSSLPVYEIARRISTGEHHMAPVSVTIPEGWNTAEMADVFASKLASFNKMNFIKDAAAKEGYLFPDTYFFSSLDTEQNVLKSMSDNFDKKIAPLRPSITSSGHSEKDIITMASIVEKEANGNDDREFIAGILWKRISIGMALQADAAPETYKVRGLPKKPIGNPGILALKAAISPATSPYLYYLHDADGVIHYAKTFEEHKANKLKYLQHAQS